MSAVPGRRLDVVLGSGPLRTRPRDHGEDPPPAGSCPRRARLAEPPGDATRLAFWAPGTPRGLLSLWSRSWRRPRCEPHTGGACRRPRPPLRYGRLVPVGAGVQEKPARYCGTWLRPATRRQGRALAEAERYSRKVQQPARIPEDWYARPETLTCTYVLLWMACLLCASRGPGVRVPLAPQIRDIIRNREPRYGDGYSSKVQQRRPHEMAHTRSNRASPSPTRPADSRP
jgi:hypothetical protein